MNLGWVRGLMFDFMPLGCITSGGLQLIGETRRTSCSRAFPGSSIWFLLSLHCTLLRFFFFLTSSLVVLSTFSPFPRLRNAITKMGVCSELFLIPAQRMQHDSASGAGPRRYCLTLKKKKISFSLRCQFTDTFHRQHMPL